MARAKLTRFLTREVYCYKSTSVLLTTRHCHSSNERREDGSDFKMVYRLPSIVFARVICRLKLYQTAIVVSLTGASVATNADLFFPLTVCTLSLGMLALMGEFFRRLVGIVYVDAATNRVKLAHLNFWGNRKDLVVRVEDIVPLTDSGENSDGDVYVRVNFYDTATYKPLYLSVKYGKVLDEKLFSQVFTGTI